MKKPNPIEVMFEDKRSSVVDKRSRLEKRFRDLKNFNEGCNNDDDDDDNNNNIGHCQEVIYHRLNICHHLLE